MSAFATKIREQFKARGSHSPYIKTENEPVKEDTKPSEQPTTPAQSE